MKLNNKGYLLVEIIIASTLALTIAYYLINTTYKFKNTSTDIYQAHQYLNDKIIITKNIMNDLEDKTIASLISDSTTIEFSVYDNNNPKQLKKRKLQIIKGNETIIKYGKINEEGEFVTTDISYYEKKLDKTLNVGDIELIYGLNSIDINIPISGFYNNNYSIKIYANTYAK